MGILLQQLLLLGIEACLVLLQILEHLQLLLVEIVVWQRGLRSAILLLETLVRCCIISRELCLIIQFAYSLHNFFQEHYSLKTNCTMIAISKLGAHYSIYSTEFNYF